MSTTVSARRLLGRSSECAALEQLVASVRAGLSRALVLRGEAGVGKSALLEYLAQHSSRCAVARTAGVESEMELAYAGCQLLCARFLDRVERFPGIAYVRKPTRHTITALVSRTPALRSARREK